MAKEFLKERNAQAQLDCCRSTLRRVAMKADAVVHLGRAVRYDMEKIEAYLEAEKASIKAD